MKSKKPDKNIAGMDVLNDIRGLLSVTQEKANTPEPAANSETRLAEEITGLKAQIKSYEELVQRQKGELRNMENENKALSTKLTALESGKAKIVSPASTANKTEDDTAQVEARMAELSTALSKMGELTRLKSQELLRRIGRLFQESGQGEVTLEFRKGASGLDVAENFAHFIRALLD